VIGVPLDLGADRRGVDMGPSAIRSAGLFRGIQALGHRVVDAGNIHVKQPEMQSFGHEKAKYLNEVAEACEALAHEVTGALREGMLPLVLGGDHSLAIGSIAGVASHARSAGGRFGLLWFDAHGDMNTPDTSPSGNIHGMPFAVNLGLGDPRLTGLEGFQPKLDRGRSVLVGVRNLDRREKDALRESGIHVFTMRDIDELRMTRVIDRALAIVMDGTAGFHVSFDVDFIDPQVAPGVGTPVKGGATYRESHLAMERIADSGKMLSMDLVEVNPLVDQKNSTAQLGVELVLSALGKRIL
jgi:arginase